jgi:hypothetical protein
MLFYWITNESKSFHVPIPMVLCLNTYFHQEMLRSRPEVQDLLEYQQKFDPQTIRFLTSTEMISIATPKFESEPLPLCSSRHIPSEDLDAIQAVIASKNGTPPVVPPTYETPFVVEMNGFSDGFYCLLNNVLWSCWTRDDENNDPSLYRCGNYFEQQLLYSFYSAHIAHRASVFITEEDIHKLHLVAFVDGLQQQYERHAERQKQLRKEDVEKRLALFNKIAPKPTPAPVVASSSESSSSSSTGATTDPTAAPDQSKSLLTLLEGLMGVSSWSSRSDNEPKKLVLEQIVESQHPTESIYERFDSPHMDASIACRTPEICLLKHDNLEKHYVPNLACVIGILKFLRLECHYYVPSTVYVSFLAFSSDVIPYIHCMDAEIAAANQKEEQTVAPEVIPAGTCDSAPSYVDHAKQIVDEFIASTEKKNAEDFDMYWARTSGIRYCGSKYDNQFSAIMASLSAAVDQVMVVRT